MAYDVDAIKQRADLLALVGADTRLRKVAPSEWAGPCPRCGGEDRLHVTPEWWMCRQCHEKRGDAIEYLTWRDGLTFAEACKALGGELSPGQTPAPRSGAQWHTPALAPVTAPGDLWQKRARAFVAYAQRELWKRPDALAYLRGRGLSDETIERAGLGYNPRAMQRRDVWAHEGRAVYLVPGWVIPCEMGGALWYVKIRQLPGKEPRYLAVRGSHKAGVVYGLDAVKAGQDLIICEGEFNALILAQVLEGAAAVVSIGDAGNEPGLQALAIMAMCRRWWLIFDPDKAGQHGRDKLAKTYARARALSWPWSVDLNDAYLAGADLRAWAMEQIEPAPAMEDAARLELAALDREPLVGVRARVPETVSAPQDCADVDAALESMGGWSWGVF